MDRTRILIIGGAAIFLIAGIAQFCFPQSAVAPQPVTSEPLSVATTSVVEVKKVTITTGSTKATHALPSIAKGDVVASWDFKGVYAEYPDLVAKAEAEITRLLGLLGKETYSDTSIYVGIANQYDLLGNGKQEYDYLGRAIKADADATSGLPWHNLGVLMEKLGALGTARAAYEQSTLVQPKMKFYHYAYFEFLTTKMKSDTADIEKEYAAALKNLGQDSDILSLYADWKQS